MVQGKRRKEGKGGWRNERNIHGANIGERGGRVTQREVQVYYYYEESESRRNI